MNGFRFGVRSAPCKQDNVIIDGDMRLSVISDRILRVEKGVFTNCMTQLVVCRNFAEPNFNYIKTDDKHYIVTDACTFVVSADGKRAGVETPEGICYPSNKTNLGGTARTLDGTMGHIGGWKHAKDRKDHFFFPHIRKGIFASNGVSEIDDSRSFLLEEDGSIKAREGGTDKYIFAFGDDYLGGLREFYNLTGFPPVLPKYALSNWWSRYHAYTDKEYLGLMDEFARRRIPFTVATVDMDWHIVKNVPKDAECHSLQGKGWTGYTFEKSLFPDYKAFLKGLKDRGLAVTMNLHPRDGVRYFEVQYPEMAKAMGIDPSTKQTVRFDLTDPRFLEAYFDILHHPYENDGVDFWWIDWQQGTKSSMRGLDPLWLLNHYHYMDSCRDGRTGLILSRYAGLGSHRYPLGFSGDTFVMWSSLAFQPYFTALASNAGYTWWSHDIGGHVLGHGDQQLYLRWVQLGVFSPINRLHSNTMSRSKEPWLYNKVENIAVDFLRLRHRLLPYIYSASVRTAKEGLPLICPMYYYDTDEHARSGKYRNQYYFGEQMLVCPVTKKAKCAAKIKIWLPKGKWTDFFDGKTYEGGREFKYICPLDRYPVFVKDGAIVPLLKDGEHNTIDYNSLEVRLYPGECDYDLYDEGGHIKFSMRRDGDGFALETNCAEGKGSVKDIEFKIEGGEYVFENGGDTMRITDFDPLVILRRAK